MSSLKNVVRCIELGINKIWQLALICNFHEFREEQELFLLPEKYLVPGGISEERSYCEKKEARAYGRCQVKCESRIAWGITESHIGFLRPFFSCVEKKARTSTAPGLLVDREPLLTRL